MFDKCRSQVFLSFWVLVGTSKSTVVPQKCNHSIGHASRGRIGNASKAKGPQLNVFRPLLLVIFVPLQVFRQLEAINNNACVLHPQKMSGRPVFRFALSDNFAILCTDDIARLQVFVCKEALAKDALGNLVSTTQHPCSFFCKGCLFKCNASNLWKGIIGSQLACHLFNLETLENLDGTFFDQEH